MDTHGRQIPALDPKTKPIDTHGIRQWPEIHRSRRPYVIEPLTITSRPARFEAAIEPLAPTFLLDPIGDHLLRLQPGEPDSFIEFAEQFGISEFIDWLVDLERSFELGEAYESGRRHFTCSELADLWRHPDLITAFKVAQQALEIGYESADQPHGNTETLQRVVRLGWEQSAFRIDFDVDPETNWVYEKPRHIFARAWLELVDNVAAGRIPKECPTCGNLFTPTRTNHHFDTLYCREKEYTGRVRKTDWYRQKEQKRKQRDRGQITDAEYQKWREDNPRRTGQTGKEN